MKVVPCRKMVGEKKKIKGSSCRAVRFSTMQKALEGKGKKTIRLVC